MTTADGVTVGTPEQPFLWHPWLYHVGRHWRAPGAGNYRIRVQIEAPTVMRHDHGNGKRFAAQVAVEFDRLIKPGQKRAAEAAPAVFQTG